MTSPALWVVIPVKPFREGKSRLAGVLSAAARAALTQRHLARLLGVLNGFPVVARTLLVSRETLLVEEAAHFGVDLYAEKTTAGLNATLMEVTAWIGGRAGRLLILPSDLPFVTAADVEQLLRSRAPGVICSDRHGTGTNALVVPTGSGFRFQYGPGSFVRHRHEFEHTGTAYETIAAEGLLFDLDTPEDWALLQAKVS